MSLPPGARLGSYEVLAKLGEGGMGQVYQARDTKLNRHVALKILPPAFVADADRRARFEREARTLAALSHPNIAQIFGLEDPSTSSGQAALVMELVEGDDLSAIIARGPVPLADALPIARQIAQALEAAHDQGIVHRDLKPANVKVKADGTVKVLDFGLAKAVDPAGTSSSNILSNSPTITSPATELGMILGTAAYMSPEQARGKAVDRRADVWAFGVVLYEMLTGRRAFTGSEVSDVLASVLKDTVALDRLPADTPPSVRRLLRRCLEKDRSARLDSMTAARLEIDDARGPNDGAPDATVPAPRTPPGRLIAVAVVAALAGGAIAAGWIWRRSPVAPAAPTTIVAMPPIGGGPLGTNVNQPDLAISPDGRSIVYGDAQGDDATLTVRSLDRPGDVPLRGLGLLPRAPFFSADGQWLGYFSAGEAGTDGKLMKVPMSGGTPSLIARVPSNLRGASWTSAGVIYFGSADLRTGLWRINADGGAAAEQLTTPAENEIDHVWPSVMPNGKHVLYAISRRNPDVGTLQWDIAALDVATKTSTIVQRGGSSPRYLSTGHLTYVNERGLMGIAMDPLTLATSGEPVTLIADAMFKPTSGAADFGVSAAGTVVYVGGSHLDRRSLSWLDRKGYATPIPVAQRRYQSASLSPDGKRFVSVVDDGGIPSLWVYDLARNADMKLTPDTLPSFAPVWTSDGSEIFFRATGPARGIYRVPAAGTTAPARVIADVGDAQLQPFSFEPGDRALAITYSAPDRLPDFQLLTLAPQPTLAPLLAEAGRINAPEISPDGRWMSYLALSSNDVELYLRPYPNVSADRIKIAAGGARSPRWAESGRALFYQDGPGSRRFWRVAIGTTANDIGKPVRIPLVDELNVEPIFDVTADGQRILIIRRVVDQKSASELRIIFNWFEDVRAKFAAK